ncbi:hypothetical protein ACTXT7_005254 [Hymenolepis weldensis]
MSAERPEISCSVPLYIACLLALSYALIVNEKTAPNLSTALFYLASPVLHNPDYARSVLTPPSFVPIPLLTPFSPSL